MVAAAVQWAERIMRKVDSLVGSSDTRIAMTNESMVMGIPLTQVSPTSSMRRWWKSIRVI